jgi:cell pole-organizing protein PopZ
MSAQPKANEPSMEEILASIRRIIADDEVKASEAKQEASKPDDDISALLAGAAAAQNMAATPAPAVAVDDDVLDLASEASLVVEAPVTPSPANDAGDVEFLEPAPVAPLVEPEPPVQVAMPAQPAPAPALDMAQLLSDQASSSVASAFGQLAHTVLTNNARTLEDLVKDMLKPMLKSWLDDNLPTMVERLVRAEIERVARGGRP